MGLQIRSPAAQVKTLKLAHTSATVSKEPVLVNAKVLIPQNTAGANELNSYVYEAEISGAPKATGGAFMVNGPVYWDNTAKNFTATSTSNTLVGYALEAALSADTKTGLIAFNTFA